MPEQGAKRNPVDYEYTGLNFDFIKCVAQIADYADKKYGDAEQYADGRLEGNRSPVNHIIEHVRQYQARETHDHFGTLKHQLAAIAYNAMMEFFYLEHGGGSTVSDKLYKDAPWLPTLEVRDVVQDAPVPITMAANALSGIDSSSLGAWAKQSAAQNEKQQQPEPPKGLFSEVFRDWFHPRG